METPEQLTIAANGLTFGALAWGDPEAPLALLAHGYPDTAWSWRHVGPLLAAGGWRAVAPFTRGYAPSDMAPDGRYRITELAADLLALQSALGGDERAVLIGHDWGAVATWAVTGIEPQRFAAHVALSIPPGAALVDVWRSRSTLGVAARQARLSWYLLYNQLPGAERTLDRLIPKLWRDWSPGYDADEDVARVFDALRGAGRRSAALGYYRDNLRGGLKATLTQRPGAPVLYLHGEQDGCMQAALGEASRPHLTPGSRFEVVPGAGHFLQLEQPGAVAALITEWIGAPTPTDPARVT